MNNIYKFSLEIWPQSLAQSAVPMRQILCKLSEKVLRLACTEKKHKT